MPRAMLGSVDCDLTSLGPVQQLLFQALGIRTALWQNLKQTLVFGAAVPWDILSGSSALVIQTTNAAHAMDAPTLNGAAISAAVLTALAGTILTLRFRNTSGVAAANPTFNAIYKIQGGAFASAATANSRALTLECDGTNWVEVSRNAADVPN